MVIQHGGDGVSCKPRIATFLIPLIKQMKIEDFRSKRLFKVIYKNVCF